MTARNTGFTLMETMIASATLIILFAAVAIIVQIALKSIGEARVRGQAIRMASQQLELVRNLAYDQIGVIGGIPAGPLQPDTATETGGVIFTMKTSVIYIDDPFDGVAPDDLLPNDYKRIRIEVNWNGLFSSKRPVIMMTDIAPRGIESISGAGTLSILVFDASGQPVTNALVRIEADEVSPPVAMDAFTDANGRVLLPGAPVCAGCYRISVTKNGYTSDRTYGMDEVANPVKPHLSVIEARLSEVSFAIDVPATLTIRATRSKIYDYSPFTGVVVTLKGTKIIGRTDDDEFVYKVDERVVTGTGGAVTINNLEWDRYSLDIPENATVDFAGSWPFSPVFIEPGTTNTATVVVEPASPHSLLVQLTDGNHQPIQAAVLELSRPNFVATSSTGIQGKGDYSQAFFRNLEAVNYDLTIRADGL
jgi:type II secretory pathway pseudopilin PulG